MKKNKENTTDVALIEQPKDQSVETFISQAIASNLPIETMEKLLGLRERVQAERAKTAYVQSVSNFQSICPVIKKTKKVMNKDGHTVRYMYAPMDSIIEQIRKPLSENNLSYSWEVKNEPGFITAVATIKHTFGHSESSEFKVPIDTEGYMTAPHKYASALTFAKRYSLCNALGISSGEEDTDATDVKKEASPKSPKSKIVFLLRTLNRKTTTKSEIEAEVKTLTSLTLEEKNYEEIVDRLETIVQENNEDTEIR